MALAWLQSYIEATFPSACVPVDLLKIGRSQSYPNPSPRPGHEFAFPFEYPDFYFPTPFCVVIDGECCLHRLYGGFFGDWVCGGQWNRMVDFLTTLIQVLLSNNIEVTVFLNGASEPHRLDKWIEKQRADKEKITQVLRHVSVKGTPPPKVWWVPPNSLRSCLRMALRHLNVNVIMSTIDHHQDVINFVRKQHYHALVAEDSEYLVLDPPRLFSAENLKLTFKGCLETKEFIMNEVTRCLNLHPSRICIVAALLGNHIVSETDLALFHHRLGAEEKGKIPPNKLIKAVVDYVRNIPSVDDLDVVANLVFGQCQDKMERFKRCVFYFARGNKNATRFHTNGPGFQNQVPDELGSNKSTGAIGQTKEEIESSPDISKFASETAETERSSLQAYRQVLSKAKHTSAYYQILQHQDERNCDGCTFGNNTGDNCASPSQDVSIPISNCGDPSFDSLPTIPMAALTLNSKPKKKSAYTEPQADVPLLPKVSAEVMRIARERHQRGLMNSYVFQVLSQGELKLPTTFEDETNRELPSPSLLFRPIRRMVYALLFNHHHLKYLAEQKKEKDGIDEKPAEIIIKEYVWCKTNKYNRPDLVPSMPLGWAVPTITRLWFGSGVEENKRRLQAFLTCMRSNSSLIKNLNYVSQHCLIMCCVLRYMLSDPEHVILRKQELDAFLVQAVDPLLTDVTETQKLELPLITTRGIQLAALFMTGVEHAMFANDACGAPVPWLMCCPWLFFDGKLFHRMLLKANVAKNLVDLCDNRLEEVAKVERMKAAILEGVPQVQFAHSAAAVGQRAPPPPPFHNFPVPVPGLSRGRGHQRVVPRGGQLEVAGVVVGSWGPNYGQGPRSPSRSIPPQVVSVGGATRGRGTPLVNIPRGPLIRPVIHTNKINSAGRKPIIKTRPDAPKTGNDNSGNLTMYRTLGRGCSLDINSESLQFTNMNQGMPSSDSNSTICWDSSFTSENKDL